MNLTSGLSIPIPNAFVATIHERIPASRCARRAAGHVVARMPAPKRSQSSPTAPRHTSRWSCRRSRRRARAPGPRRALGACALGSPTDDRQDQVRPLARRPHDYGRPPARTPRPRGPPERGARGDAHREDVEVWGPAFGDPASARPRCQRRPRPAAANSATLNSGDFHRTPFSTPAKSADFHRTPFSTPEKSADFHPSPFSTPEKSADFHPSPFSAPAKSADFRRSPISTPAKSGDFRCRT
jgi:hypothetical protein